MKKLIKITSLLLIIFMFASSVAAFAHDLGTVSDFGIDYESWDSEPPASAAMPTPEPSPTPTPTPEPVRTPPPPAHFREVEIARATTTYGLYASQANRNNNMELATHSIDYTIINNGGNFSFNDVVGARTAERGYKEATIFVGQGKTQGLGGGICQISSTVYMAAKKARLRILERYPHSLPVTYCSREDEATVSWGYLDFRFQNNTGDPIRIEASCSGGVVKVIIYQRVPIYD